MSGHSEREHRRFSPSQAERFSVCKGSTRLLERVPARPSGPYAIEGTTAHEVLEAGLANGLRTAREAHEASIHCCVELDDEHGGPYENFYFSIQTALNHVYHILADNPGAEVWLERRVSPPILNAPGEADGFCDILIWCPIAATLYVIDYKHGAGVSKNVVDNKQVKQYGSGALYGVDAVVDPQLVDTVVLCIMQPRAFHKDGMIREYETTPWELYEYLDELDEWIDGNLDPRAALVPDDNGKTTDHCRFCDAKTICPAREAKALSPLLEVSSKLMTIENVTAPSLPEPSSLDMLKLGRIRAAADMLRKWLGDVEDHVKELLMQGYDVPGAKLVEVQARRQWWGDPADTARKAAVLAECSVEELMTAPKLLPLTQVEAMVVEAFKHKAPMGKKKKASEEAKRAFAFLTIKQTSGNLTVADDTDPRPAVKGRVEAFSQIGGALINRE